MLGPSGERAMRPTYDGVAPELGHFPKPHGRQQRLPHLQLEHVAEDDAHGLAHLPAVIYHRVLLVTLRGSEMKRHLVPRTEGSGVEIPPEFQRRPPSHLRSLGLSSESAHPRLIS